MNFDELYLYVEGLRSKWDGLFGRARSHWEGFDQPMAVLNGLSSHDLDNGFRVALELLLSIRPSSGSSPECVVLAMRHQDIKTALQGIDAQVTSGFHQLSSNWRDEARIVSLDAQFHWGLEDKGSRYAEVNLNGVFQSLPAPVSALMAALGTVVPLCSLDSVGDLAARSDAFSKLLSDIQPLYSKAKSHANRSEVAEKKAEEKVAEIEALAQQADADLARLRELLKGANSDHGQVTEQTARIQQITNTAESLSQAVTQYQAKFDDFKAAMDERLEDLSNFEKRSRDAYKRNQDYEERTKELIAQSEDMLKGSTTVGLAKSMEDARVRYEKRMNSTRVGFYLSVVFLLISAWPLAIHLIPGLVELLQWFSGQDGKPMPTLNAAADGSPYAVLGKIMLLLPATWLTAFFTKTYAHLFQLEREYAHKAALAGSVHGFKLQAKKYEEEITAEVFMEIRMNPAHGPTVDAASHPLYDVLAKVVNKGLNKMGSTDKDKTQ